jgi:serine/threonine protein phosphatase PrpC
MGFESGWATARGRRPDNQDRAAVADGWVVVSDGAGGMQGGARAAQLTVAAAVARLEASAGRVDDSVVREAVQDANASVLAGQREDPTVAFMAATLTLGVLAADRAGGSLWLVAGVGDSPAWLVTAERITRVTDDDNAAAELVRAGVISQAEARTHPGRHMITRAMGSAEAVPPDVAHVALFPGDALVVASDGIDVLDDADIGRIVRSAAGADAAAQRLVDAALDAGSADNVTAVVVRQDA